MRLREIQQEHKEWSRRNFGVQEPWKMILGMTEELGELSHAYLKRAQNIRTHEGHDEQERDAAGDIFVYWMGFCTESGIDVEDLINEVWSSVKKRDWQKNKDTAHLETK